MFTMNDIANLFGGTIPVWFWIVAAIVIIVLIVLFSGSSSGSGGKSFSRGDIKISRDMDGSYYAYDPTTSTVLFTAPTKQEVANWVASQVR